MAQPRMQCLNAARRFAQKPLEIRAAFSSSIVVRTGAFTFAHHDQLSPILTLYIDDPSRITAADGLLASLDEHVTSRSPSSSQSSDTQSHPQPVRLPIRNTAHAPTRSGSQRIAAMVSDTLARRARQNQNLLAGRRPGQPSLTTVQELENAKRASELSKQIPRRWRAGDVYAPHDISAVEMEKWRSRQGPKHDIFDVLNFKPLENYRVRLFLSPLSLPLCFPFL